VLGLAANGTISSIEDETTTTTTTTAAAGWRRISRA
jgi:hypothetical protein